MREMRNHAPRCQIATETVLKPIRIKRNRVYVVSMVSVVDGVRDGGRIVSEADSSLLSAQASSSEH